MMRTLRLLIILPALCAVPLVSYAAQNPNKGGEDCEEVEDLSKDTIKEEEADTKTGETKDANNPIVEGEPQLQEDVDLGRSAIPRDWFLETDSLKRALWAIDNKNLTALCILQGSEDALNLKRWQNWREPLQHALDSGDLDTLQWLLENGIPVSTDLCLESGKRYTILDHTVDNLNIDFIRRVFPFIHRDQRLSIVLPAAITTLRRNIWARLLAQDPTIDQIDANLFLDQLNDLDRGEGVLVERLPLLPGPLVEGNLPLTVPLFQNNVNNPNGTATVEIQGGRRLDMRIFNNNNNNNNNNRNINTNTYSS